MSHTIQDRRERRDLALGLGLSAGALGAFLAAAPFLGLEVHRAPADGAELALFVVTEDELEPEVRLGIERSRIETPNWLGFDTPTEHAAPESTVEQSAMTLEETKTSERMLMAVAREVMQALAAAARPATVTGVQESPEAASDGRDVPDALPAVPVSSGDGEEGTAEGVAPGTAPVAEARTDDETFTGIPTDKEAVAAALRSAPLAVPGRVVAAEGLEISTRRPQWSRTTLSTTRPRNPVVWITFGRDGRVRRAGFLRDGERVYDTGYASVDEPLINAVYRWRARGRPLEDLPRENPEAGITVTVKVLLVG